MATTQILPIAKTECCKAGIVIRTDDADGRYCAECKEKMSGEIRAVFTSPQGEFEVKHKI